MPIWLTLEIIKEKTFFKAGWNNNNQGNWIENHQGNWTRNYVNKTEDRNWNKNYGNKENLGLIRGVNVGCDIGRGQ